MATTTTTNLSGMMFQPLDGGLVPIQTTPTTDSLLVIGCAVDGPVNTPRRISSFEDAQTMFGPVIFTANYPSLRSNGAGVDPLKGKYNGNSLVKAAYEALQGGAGDIRLLRIGGVAASYVGVTGTAGAGSLALSADSEELFSAVAAYPGRIYNGVEASFGPNPAMNLTLTGVAATTGQISLAPTGSATNTFYVTIEQTVTVGTSTKVYVSSEQMIAFTSGSSVKTIQADLTSMASGTIVVHIKKSPADYNSAAATSAAILNVSATGQGAISIQIGYDNATPSGFTAKVLNGAATGTITSGAGAAVTLASDYAWTVTQPAIKGGTQTIPVVLSMGITVQDIINVLNASGLNRSVFVIADPDVGSLEAVDTDVNGVVTAVHLAGSLSISGGWDGTTAQGEMYDDSSVNTVAGSSAATTTKWPQASNSDYVNYGKHGLYLRLIDSFDLLHDYQVDFILLSALYADDEVGDTAPANELPSLDSSKLCLLTGYTDGEGTVVLKGFAQFLNELNRDTYPCVGIVGTRPLAIATIANINALAASLGWTSTGATPGCESDYRRGVAREDRCVSLSYFLKDQLSNYQDSLTQDVIDLGSNLVLVAHDVQLNQRGNLGLYVDNAMGVFAGLMTKLIPQSGATNKQIPGVQGLAWTYTRPQLEMLNGGVGKNDLTGFAGGGAPVVMRNLFEWGNVVVNDNTLAHRGSDYDKLTTKRIMNLALQITKAIAFPYIGESNESATLMALKTQIRTGLQKMVESGALRAGEGQGFSFALLNTNNDPILGNLRIQLALTPALQIRRIIVTATVSM